MEFFDGLLCPFDAVDLATGMLQCRFCASYAYVGSGPTYTSTLVSNRRHAAQQSLVSSDSIYGVFEK